MLKSMSRMTPNSNVYYGKGDEYNIELTVEQPNIEISTHINPTPIPVQPPEVKVESPTVNVTVNGQTSMKKTVTKRDKMGRAEEMIETTVEEEK